MKKQQQKKNKKQQTIMWFQVFQSNTDNLQTDLFHQLIESL